MQFKDAKCGSTILIFDRNEIAVKSGKITNNPMPHFDPKCPAMSKMVVDLNVEVDGTSTTYVMEDNAEVGYVGNTFLTINRECLLREVESIKAQSEQALKMVDWNKSAVKKCDNIMKEYSPEYRERTETTNRLDSLEEKLGNIAKSLNAFLEQQKGGIK